MLGEVFGETNEPEFLLIAKYYDSRKAVVTISADDWENSWWQEFEEMRCGEIMSNRFSSLFSYAEYEYKLANESVITLLKYWNISLRNKKLLDIECGTPQISAEKDPKPLKQYPIITVFPGTEMNRIKVKKLKNRMGASFLLPLNI